MKTYHHPRCRCGNCFDVDGLFCSDDGIPAIDRDRESKLMPAFPASTATGEG